MKYQFNRVLQIKKDRQVLKPLSPMHLFTILPPHLNIHQNKVLRFNGYFSVVINLFDTITMNSITDSSPYFTHKMLTYKKKHKLFVLSYKDQFLLNILQLSECCDKHGLKYKNKIFSLSNYNQDEKNNAKHNR